MIDWSAWSIVGDQIEIRSTKALSIKLELKFLLSNQDFSDAMSEPNPCQKKLPEQKIFT